MIEIVLYIFIGVVFTIGILLNTASSHSQRKRFLKTYSIILIILMIFPICFNHVGKSNAISLDNYFSILLAFGVFWPILIANLIILKHKKSPVVDLKLRPFNFVIGSIGIIFMLWLSFSYATEYYGKDISSYIIFLIFCVSIIIVTFIRMIQKTLFYTDGIFHFGMFWAWSDFRSYTWKDSPSNNSRIRLLLRIEGSWFKKLCIMVPAEKTKEIELLLTQLKEVKGRTGTEGRC